MENVFAPIDANSCVIEFLIESMAVRIPTSAVIPTAIINTVSMVRNKFVRTDNNAILIFSKNKVVKRILSKLVAKLKINYLKPANTIYQ